MTWQEDAKVVRGGLGKTPTAIGAIAERHEALARLTAALKATERERDHWRQSRADVVERVETAERDRERIFKDLENVGKKLEAAEQERDALNDEWMAAEARHTESRQAAERRVAELEKEQTRGTLVRTDETIFARLRASEQRVAELKAALRGLRDAFQMHIPENEDDYRSVAWTVADAALGEGEKK